MEILEARARAADVENGEFLYEVLYAFHFRRNNFNKGFVPYLFYPCSFSVFTFILFKYLLWDRFFNSSGN